MTKAIKAIAVLLAFTVMSIDATAQTDQNVVVIPMFGDDAAAKWRGAWDNDIDYMKGDIVGGNGSSYIAKERHTSTLGDIPPDITYWDLVAASGSTGPRGPRGVQGEPGSPGAPGSPGTAATVRVGSTKTGTPGSDAAVGNSGTSSAAILDFIIPKGDKGETGLLDQATLQFILGKLPKTVFVTSRPYSADLVTAANDLNNGTFYKYGLMAGDALCQFHADEAGLPGTYKAWLSSTNVNVPGSPSTRFVQSSLPYVRTDSQLIANNWSDLTDGSISSPINLTETGGQAHNYVYTGTDVDGTSTGLDCNDWTSTNQAEFVTMGETVSIDAAWVRFTPERFTCGPGFGSITCFQQ